MDEDARGWSGGATKEYNDRYADNLIHRELREGETVQQKYKVMDERLIKYSGRRGERETVT